MSQSSTVSTFKTLSQVMSRIIISRAATSHATQLPEYKPLETSKNIQQSHKSKNVEKTFGRKPIGSMYDTFTYIWLIFTYMQVNLLFMFHIGNVNTPIQSKVLTLEIPLDFDEMLMAS